MLKLSPENARRFQELYNQREAVAQLLRQQKEGVEHTRERLRKLDEEMRKIVNLTRSQA